MKGLRIYLTSWPQFAQKLAATGSLQLRQFGLSGKADADKVVRSWLPQTALKYQLSRKIPKELGFHTLYGLVKGHVESRNSQGVPRVKAVGAPRQGNYNGAKSLMLCFGVDNTTIYR